jgi:aldose sugar dehydrogenase
MRIVTQDGKLSAPLTGVPKVLNEGQGGLLDVILDPAFDKTKLIYFSYAEPEAGKAGTAVARARLTDTALEEVRVIFRQQPKVGGGNHFGSRLAFARDGTLFIGLGERFNHSDRAQTLDNHLGKVVRINSDGTVPPDNPFIKTKDALPEIWSYGHRNIQGMAVHPVTGEVWIHEHGPRGGDEINIPKAGKNYGWPEASYGSHYSMVPIPDEHASRGFVEPIHYWTPSIAPAGMAFYTAARFPAWKNSLFLGALAKQYLTRVMLNGEKVTGEEKLLEALDERIRDVRQSPDGYIYVLTDSEDGKVVRVSAE